ncbi:uncharacterized protein [Dermacentor albipictus]
MCCTALWCSNTGNSSSTKFYKFPNDSSNTVFRWRQAVAAVTVPLVDPVHAASERTLRLAAFGAAIERLSKTSNRPFCVPFGSHCSGILGLLARLLVNKAVKCTRLKTRAPPSPSQQMPGDALCSELQTRPRCGGGDQQTPRVSSLIGYTGCGMLLRPLTVLVLQCSSAGKMLKMAAASALCPSPYRITRPSAVHTMTLCSCLMGSPRRGAVLAGARLRRPRTPAGRDWLPSAAPSVEPWAPFRHAGAER